MAKRVSTAVVTTAPAPAAIQGALATLDANAAAVATTEEAAPPAPFRAVSSKIKTTKVLTYQLLKFPADNQLCVRFVSEIWLSEPIKGEAGAKKKEPPYMVRVVNYDISTAETDGQIMEFIVPAVLKSEIEETYAGKHTDDKARDSDGNPFGKGEVPDYYGRAFIVRKFNKRTGKLYHTFDIAEVDITD